MNTSPFNKTNLYIFLIELGFSLLFLVAFTCLHYGITNATKWGKKVQKSKLFNFWYFFVFGFLLALITFVVSQISTIALGAIGMPLTIIGLIYAMTVFYNRSVQVGAIIPEIVWVLYQYNGFTEYNTDWMLRLIIVLIIAAVAISATFIKWKKWPTFLLSCLVTLLILEGLILGVTKEYTAYYCVSALISILATIFYYAVIASLNRWLTHVSRMAKQGVYIDKYYLIPTVLDEYFVDFVKRNNVSQALVISFDILCNDKQKSHILEKVYNLFKDDNALFFKSKYDSYGLILTGHKYYVNDLNRAYLGNKKQIRDVHDNLKYLEEKIQSLKNKNWYIATYVSIYGVHSNNLDSLLRSNLYNLKHNSLVSDNNIVQLFNTNMRNQEIADQISYSTLSQKVNLNDIDVELELIKVNKTNKTYVCPRFYWPKMLTCDTITILSQFERSIANTLLRSLAIKSLELYINNQEYQKYPILIYYPIDQLNSKQWSTVDLIKKIQLYGVDPNMVILSFNLKKYHDWPKQILENLIDLQKNHVKYWLVDVINTKKLKDLNPSAVILDKRLRKNNKIPKDLLRLNLNIL